MNNTAPDFFANFVEDDFDAIVTHESKSKFAKTVQHPCSQCGGTGLYKGVRIHQTQSKCFSCKGKGYFLTSQAERAKARVQRVGRQEAKKVVNISDFASANTAVYEFLKSSSSWSSFSRSLLESVTKFGGLTDNQLIAAKNALIKNTERNQARATAETTRPILSLESLFTLFNKASENGLKKPRLTIDGMTVSKAPASGVNAGSLYVTQNGQYAGKVTAEGQLRVINPFKSKEAGISEQLNALAADPLGFAMSYGRRTGNCCCCNKLLTRTDSIELGIGPICKDKWGL